MTAGPVLAEADHGGIVARRAVLHWVWRLSRREWRQQILMVALLAAAVALMIVGSGLAVNSPSDSTAATFGTAGKIITIPGSDRNLAAEFAFLRRNYGPFDVIEEQTLATGTTQAIVLRAQNPHGRYGQPMLALESGQYPDGPGQVAVTSGVASLFGLRTGGIWHEDGKAWRITGVVEDPANLLDQFALVAPGQLTHPTSVRILLTATDNGHGFGGYPGETLQYRPAESGSLNGLPNRAVDILGVAVLGLVFTGLAAFAGFTVMAQRRRRALGLLAAVGATARDLKMVMLASGVTVGVSGTLAGAAAGLAAWAGYAPRLQAITEHRVQWTDLPWWVIGTIVPLTVLTAVAAAWWPARSVARTPVVQALSGRPVRRSRPGRLAVRSAVVLAAGVCFLAITGTGTGGTVADLLLAVGLAATVTGALLLLTPLAVAWPAGIVRNAPAAVLFAVRDLGRYRAQYGAALAAVTVAVFLAALTCVLAAAGSSDASPLRNTGPDNVAANQLVIWAPDAPPAVTGNADAISLSGPATATLGPPVPPAAELTALAAKATALAASIHAKFVLPLETTHAPFVRPLASTGIPGAILWQAGQPLGFPGIGRVSGPGGYSFTRDYGTLYVATPALLRDFGITPSPDADVLTIRPGLAGLPGLELLNPMQTLPWYRCTAPCRIGGPVVQAAGRLPTGTDAPNTVITEHAVHTLGLQTSTDGWLIQTARPLTAAQISTARQLAIAGGTDIETQTPPPPDPATLKNVVTAAGLVAALCVTVLTVALVRAEAARDLRTLTAAGAASRHRRALAATTAGTLGLLGAMLGTALAYLTVIAWAHDRLTSVLNPVPAADLVVLLAGLPLTAGFASWLLSGREPPSIARRPLD